MQGQRMNIFREILKHIPKSKIEIMPNDPKNEYISKQLTIICNYSEKNQCIDKE
jgi:hypothetical protein